MRSRCDLLLFRLRAVVTCEPAGDDPLGTIRDGAVAVRDGRIAAVGTMDELQTRWEPAAVEDCGGALATPGLVDCHTHVVWAGDRSAEFEMRLAGKSYPEIAAGGGGILSTVKATREAKAEDLLAAARARLRRMLSHGTTTVEIKSGYGLDLESELKILGVIAALRTDGAPDVIPTFLGAHEVPGEFREMPEAYLQMLCEFMIPEVARRGLAEFCDVFCEKGVFDADQSRTILSAARKAGFKLKVHAEEFVHTGGARLAADLKAVSADHLMAAAPADLNALKKSKTVPVLLPGTTFALGLKSYAPARAMLAAGLPVALATDCNPGTCPAESLPFIVQIACTQMRMTPAEALLGVTRNAALAVDRGHDRGTLAPGKRADLVLWDYPDARFLAYHMGGGRAVRTYVRGRAVWP